MTLRPGQYGPAAPRVVTTVLTKGAARITGINATTRQGVMDLINGLVADGVLEGMSPAELGDVIAAWSGWDEARAELIARTELGTAYNQASIATGLEAGAEMWHVTDGDQDEECEPWADVEVPTDELPDELGHPNCTRDIVPIVTWTAQDYADMGVTEEP